MFENLGIVGDFDKFFLLRAGEMLEFVKFRSMDFIERSLLMTLYPIMTWL